MRLHARHALLARGEVGDVPGEHRNSRARGERVGDRVLASIVGSDAVAGVKQRFRDRGADAAGPAGDERDSPVFRCDISHGDRRRAIKLLAV